MEIEVNPNVNTDEHLVIYQWLNIFIWKEFDIVDNHITTINLKINNSKTILF